MLKIPRSGGGRLALVATVVALMTAACGEGGEDDASASAGHGSCEGAEVTYQLGYIPNPQFAGFLVAYDKGYFKDQGIEMTMKPGGPTVNPGVQVAQGTADFADFELSQALNANIAGADVKLVGQTAQQNPLRYIAWKGDVELEGPEDLMGKTVGVQEIADDMPEVAALLQTVGQSLDAVTPKKIDFGIDDFSARAVDVLPLRTYGHVAMLEIAGFTYPDDFNVLDPNEYGAGIAQEGIWVNGAFLDENPDAVACTLRAIKEGWQNAAGDPEGTSEIVEKYVPSGAFSSEVIARSVPYAIEYATVNYAGEEVEPLTIDREYLDESVATLREQGQLEGEIELDSVIETGPLDAATN